MCIRRYNGFILLRDPARLRDLGTMRFTKKKEPFKESLHPAKFDDDRHYGSGDITVLVVYVISEDHVT